jgi:hypothetical protein
MTTSVKDKVPNSVSTWSFDRGRYWEKGRETSWAIWFGWTIREAISEGG